MTLFGSNVNDLGRAGVELGGRAAGVGEFDVEGIDVNLVGSGHRRHRGPLDGERSGFGGGRRGSSTRRADRARRGMVVDAARVDVGFGLAVGAADVDLVRRLEGGVQTRRRPRPDEEERDDRGPAGSEFHGASRDYP